MQDSMVLILSGVLILAPSIWIRLNVMTLNSTKNDKLSTLAIPELNM